MIRKAEIRDKPAVLDVAVDSGLFPAEHIGELAELMDSQLELEAEGHHWIVQTNDKAEILAAAYYAPEALTDGTWNLYFIAVREAEKGQGIGSTLLLHIEATLRQNQQRVLIIETSSLDGFELTRKFYLKHGYSEEARIRDFYADGEDKVVFWKGLL